MRLDWQKIRALSLDAGLQNSDKALFILPVAGRDLLMSIMERFTWRATFRTEGYDYADWDELQAIVMETENGLMGTILMDDLIAQITRIADTLEENLCCTEDELSAINTSIQNLELVCYSGGGGGNVFETWRVPVGWENDFPQNPIPDDDTPTEESVGNLCDAAHSAHHEIREWFQAFAENVGKESPYTEIVEYMNLFALVNKSTAWFYQAMTSVITLWYDELLSDVDDFWMEIKEEFICAVVQSESGAELRGWVFERVRNNPPTWSAGMYMETLLTGTTFNIIYDGTYVPFPEFIGSDCSACEEPDFPDAPAKYLIVYPQSSEITMRNINNGVGQFDGLTFTYSAATGEWNGSFCGWNTQAILARVGGIRIDGWMVNRIAGNGNEGQFDKLDMATGTDMTMLSGDTYPYKKLWYNSSFAADMAGFIPQFNENTVYGAAPVSVNENSELWQAVSHFAHEYTYRAALLVRMVA